MQHGFAAHPAVASQYLNFLVDSRGEDAKESPVTKAVTKLEEKVELIERVAKEARAIASSTSNGLDQLKSKVNNLSRNRSNGDSDNGNN